MTIMNYILQSRAQFHIWFLSFVLKGSIICCSRDGHISMKYSLDVADIDSSCTEEDEIDAQHIVICRQQVQNVLWFPWVCPLSFYL